MEAGRVGEGEEKTFLSRNENGRTLWRLPLVGHAASGWSKIFIDKGWPSHGSRDSHGAVFSVVQTGDMGNTFIRRHG